MTQHTTVMLRSSHSAPLISVIWGNEILYLPLCPCTVVLSGFLQSTTIAAQILLRAFHVFSSHTFAEHSRPLQYGQYSYPLCYKWFYRKDHLVVSCPNAHLPALLHLFAVECRLSLLGAPRQSPS